MEPFLANNDDWMGEFGFSPSQPSPSDRSDRQNNFGDGAPKGAIPGPKPTDNYFPFTKSPDLDNLPSDDVTFLRQQGCFNLPPKEALDEFVREYFLHVHPMLPLMDESAFWDQYSGVEERNTSTLSLLGVQAMLYASSCFVSESVTKGLGFECPRFAAAEFYRRAKLLYDFETESSTVDLARGALLLAFWPGTFGSGHPNPNSVWLTRAIQHAKCLGANKAWSGLEESRKPPDAPDITSLKRLWWCCIIRDRSLSLGLRRYIQIPGRYPPLEDEDFKSELDGSLVYTPDTKAQLFKIFQRLMVFSNIVTDLLQLTSRSRGILYDPKTTCSDDRTILAQCREDLSAWFSTTGEEFLGMSRPGQLRHQSIIVYTNLAYIHY
ncbi:N-terminal binuclear Zn cluster-containing DNA binding domain-containing [Fusarium albosuccineum]|uniref:N-terminal binuclear Zn cluster-containing DNA binding domain-containing n=1 Tax=Fusarium albosuccineum TaxID=1237068 RepID=A0A8H4PAZ6_9HYPO|nr:N-terminal binuclear Zn cluster-containing DNA binding domain-containing [Fusarium albosuccineum]